MHNKIENIFNVYAFLDILNQKYTREGKEIYFIGGASRCIIAKKSLPQDLDFSSNASPDITEIFLQEILSCSTKFAGALSTTAIVLAFSKTFIQ